MTSKKLSQHEQDFADAMALNFVLIESKGKRRKNAVKTCQKGMASLGYRLRERNTGPSELRLEEALSNDSLVGRRRLLKPHKGTLIFNNL